MRLAMHVMLAVWLLVLYVALVMSLWDMAYRVAERARLRRWHFRTHECPPGFTGPIIARSTLELERLYEASA